MKIHTTNYINTFIEVADDCKAGCAEIPPLKNGEPTAANIQFELLSRNPYKFTSDEVLFKVFAVKNDIIESELFEARQQFFSKGQACFRASPLTKRYGWGIHYNAEGKMALVALESETYEKFATDKQLKVVKAMKLNK